MLNVKIEVLIAVVSELAIVYVKEPQTGIEEVKSLILIVRVESYRL